MAAEVIGSAAEVGSVSLCDNSANWQMIYAQCEVMTPIPRPHKGRLERGARVSCKPMAPLPDRQSLAPLECR